MPKSTEIKMEILRSAGMAFSGTTSLAERKGIWALKIARAQVIRDGVSFPLWHCVLVTGTGIVPEDTFTLQGPRTRRSPSATIRTVGPRARTGSDDQPKGERGLSTATRYQ